MKEIELTNEIAKALSEYSEEVQTELDNIIERNANELINKLKETSPRKTGSYAKGWTKKKVVENGITGYIVYNKTKPQLTHLLEFGHAKRGGGRVAGIPHIGPARDEIEKKIVEDVSNTLKRVG